MLVTPKTTNRNVASLQSMYDEALMLSEQTMTNKSKIPFDKTKTNFDPDELEKLSEERKESFIKAISSNGLGSSKFK